MEKETLKILGHEYELVGDHGLTTGHGAVAICDTVQLKIAYNPHFPESRVRESILHEIIEALNAHLELELEHSVLTALSEGLFSVMEDNGFGFLKFDEERCNECGDVKERCGECGEAPTCEMLKHLTDIVNDRDMFIAVQSCPDFRPKAR